MTFLEKSCHACTSPKQINSVCCPPSSSPCAIKPCTLPKNRGDSLLWDFFSPFCFLFALESCLLVVEDRGLLHLFLPFTFPCAKLRLKCCRFLQTLNLEQASDPTEFCGTWVLQILPVLELWQHQSPSFLLEKVSPNSKSADSSGATHLSLHFPSLGIQSEGGNFF